MFILTESLQVFHHLDKFQIEYQRHWLKRLFDGYLVVYFALLNFKIEKQWKF